MSWRRGLLIAGLLGLFSAATLIGLADRFFGFQPPAGVAASVAASQALPIEVRAGQRWIGGSCAFERGGILACSLEGTPAERGAALARFYPEALAIVETALVDTVRRFIPNHALRWVLARVVVLRNRRLEQYVPAAIREELAAVALASKDLYPEYGGHYTRLMNYLAAHDISHAFMDTPLMACTAFGATAAFTRTRTPLLGRNFDFEAGSPFDTCKVVIKENLPAGRAFLSVAWPGMVGVVSGFNDAGVAVVLLAGHSQGRRGLGAPITVVARQILEEARTLDEAVQIATAAQVFVSESLLLGSGAENRFVVVEKTPATTAVRPMAGPVVVAANHFLSPALREDPANQAYLREGSSLARYQRMTELLGQAQARLDPAMAVSFLRDRNGPGGEALGLGNHRAINPLIASHSVVFDLARKIAWVSSSPHQLGAFIPFALERFGEPASVPEVPADPLVTDGGYQRYLAYRRGLEAAEARRAAGDPQAGLTILASIRAGNPRDYRNASLTGDCYQALRQSGEAVRWYRAALALRPAFRSERLALEKKIRRLERGRKP